MGEQPAPKADVPTVMPLAESSGGVPSIVASVDTKDNPPATGSEAQSKLATPETASSDLMQRFDQLRSQEDELGKKLDQQLLEAVKQWQKWRKTLPWTENKFGDSCEIDYKIESTTDKGEPRILIIGSGGSVIYEASSEADFQGRMDISGGNLNSLSNTRISYDQDPEGYGEINPSTVTDSLGTAYGYDLTADGRHYSRQRYIAPGMEHLGNPMDHARRILDMLQRGKVTGRSTGSTLDWEPFIQTNQPPQP